MKKNILCFAISTLLFVSMFVGLPTASASVVSLPPTDDTTADQQNPNMDFGNFANIDVFEFNNPRYSGYGWLKFDISSLAGTSIKSALLYLDICQFSSSAILMAHHSSNDAWTESTLTWANQPTFDPAYVQSELITSTGWITIDVTILIQTDINRGKTLSTLVLSELNLNNYVGFWSKENGTPSNSPYLAVEKTPPVNLNGQFYNPLGDWNSSSFERIGVTQYKTPDWNVSWGSRGILGDINQDGIVNSKDYALIVNNWLMTVPPADPRTDITSDGIVNARDVAVVASNWLMSGQHIDGNWAWYTGRFGLVDTLTRYVESHNYLMLGGQTVTFGYWVWNVRSMSNGVCAAGISINGQPTSLGLWMPPRTGNWTYVSVTRTLPATLSNLTVEVRVSNCTVFVDMAEFTINNSPDSMKICTSYANLTNCLQVYYWQRMSQGQPNGLCNFFLSGFLEPANVTFNNPDWDPYSQTSQQVWGYFPSKINVTMKLISHANVDTLFINEAAQENDLNTLVNTTMPSYKAPEELSAESLAIEFGKSLVTGAVSTVGLVAISSFVPGGEIPLSLAILFSAVTDTMLFAWTAYALRGSTSQVSEPYANGATGYKCDIRCGL